MSYLVVGNSPDLDSGSKPPSAQQSKFAGIGLVAGVAVAVVATYFLFWSSKEK